MRTVVILPDGDKDEHEDCHALVDSDGEVTISDLGDNIVDTYHHRGWAIVTTFA